MTDIFPPSAWAGLILLLAGCTADPAADGPKPDLAAPEGLYSGFMMPQFPGCGQPSPGRLQVTAGGGGLEFRMSPFQGGQQLAGDITPDGTLRLNMARTASMARAGEMGPGLTNAPILEAQLRPQGGVSSVNGLLRTGTCRWSFTLRKG